MPVLELRSEVGQQLREAELVRGAVAADGIELVVDELADVGFDGVA